MNGFNETSEMKVHKQENDWKYPGNVIFLLHYKVDNYDFNYWLCLADAAKLSVMYRVAQKSKLLYCDRYFNG